MMFTGEGASEEIVLKDGTRIRIKETILEDGSRQIVRETVDTWGNKQVETESYRETFDAESFLSIEQRTRYGHSSRSKDGTTASSSGWEGQPESRGNRTNHHRSYQDGTTLTSGWVTEEHGMGESSTYYTRSNESKSPKHKYYDDGLALSPSKTNRQYAKQSTSRISGNTPDTSQRTSHHGNRASDRPRGHSPTLDLAPVPPTPPQSSPQASPRQSPAVSKSSRPSPWQKKSPSLQQQKSTSKSPRTEQHKTSTCRHQFESPQEEAPHRSSPKIMGSSRDAYRSHLQSFSVPTRPPLTNDRFSRHVDANGDANTTDPLSEVLDTEKKHKSKSKSKHTSSRKRDNKTRRDHEKRSDDIESSGDSWSDSTGSAANSSNKSNLRPRVSRCTWIMLASCVVLIGAILALAFGWLIPTLNKNKVTTTGESPSPDDAELGLPTQSPTPFNTNEATTFPPTADVSEFNSPTASPTDDPCDGNGSVCTWQQVGRPLMGDDFGDSVGTSTALSADGKILAVGASGSAETGGYAKVYVRRRNSWIQRGQTIEGPFKNDRFGLSVALSKNGHIIAIGGDGWDGNGANNGVVRVYKYNRSMSQWEQLGSDFEGDASFDRAGWSVSLSGNGHFLAYGSPGSELGQTKVFHWNGSKWKQRGDAITLGGRTGHSIDLSEDGQVLAIGSIDGSYANVLQWGDEMEKWEPRGNTIDGRSGTHFGANVKLSSTGDILAVSAPNDGSMGRNSGLVEVFSWNRLEWERLGFIHGSNRSDLAGSSMALDSTGLKIAIGMPGSGKTAIYEWMGGTKWEAQGSFATEVTNIGTDNRPFVSVSLSSTGKVIALGSATSGDGGTVSTYHLDIAPPTTAPSRSPTFAAARPTRQSSPVAAPSKIGTRPMPPATAPGTAPAPGTAGTRPSPTRQNMPPTSKKPTTAPAPAPAPGTAGTRPSPTRQNLPPTTKKPTVPPTRRPTRRPTRKPTNRPTLAPVTARPTPMPTLMAWNQVGDIYGETSGEYMGVSTSVASQGTVVAIGGTWNGFGYGIVRIYKRDGMSWSQKGQTLNGLSPGNHFGVSLKLSNDGNTLIVGSDLDKDIGSVRIYEYNKGRSAWIQRGDTLQGSFKSDRAGWSVDITATGDVIAFGAPGSSRKYTRVYQWNGKRWVQKGRDIVSGQGSGHSISLNGNGSIIAVGALDGSYVKVYNYSGNDWREQGETISGRRQTFFGASVSLSRSGHILAIGAPQHTDVRIGSAAGLAKVYAWDGSVWIQRGSDMYGEGAFYAFGQTVSLSSAGDTLAIGSPGPRWHDVESMVYVLDWNDSLRDWVLRGNPITVGESSPYGTSSELPSYSMSMSLDGSAVALATPLNEEKGRATGNVKIFQWPNM